MLRRKKIIMYCKQRLCYVNAVNILWFTSKSAARNEFFIIITQQLLIENEQNWNSGESNLITWISLGSLCQNNLEKRLPVYNIKLNAESFKIHIKTIVFDYLFYICGFFFKWEFYKFVKIKQVCPEYAKKGPHLPEWWCHPNTSFLSS